MTFYDRYAGCCRKREIFPASESTARRIGCTRSNISSFARTGATPRGEVVAGAARMLDVSADYLLGIIDVPSPINTSLSEEEMDIIRLFRKMNKSGRIAATVVLEGLCDHSSFVKTDVHTLSEGTYCKKPEASEKPDFKPFSEKTNGKRIENML